MRMKTQQARSEELIKWSHTSPGSPKRVRANRNHQFQDKRKGMHSWGEQQHAKSTCFHWTIVTVIERAVILKVFHFHPGINFTQNCNVLVVLSKLPHDWRIFKKVRGRNSTYWGDVEVTYGYRTRKDYQTTNVCQSRIILLILSRSYPATEAWWFTILTFILNV